MKIGKLICLALFTVFPLLQSASGMVELIGPDNGDPEIKEVAGDVMAIFGFKEVGASVRKFKQLCIKVCLYRDPPDIFGGDPQLACATITITKSDIKPIFMASGWTTTKDFQTLTAVGHAGNPGYELQIVDVKPCPDTGSTLALSAFALLVGISARRVVRKRKRPVDINS